MGVRATVSHPLVVLAMCKVSNVATRTWNHEMMQHHKYVKKKQRRVAAKTEHSRVVHVMIVDC